MTKENHFNFLLIVLIASLMCFDVYGARKIEQKDYFASIRASKANIRSGPGQHYPVKFTFNARSIPVHVVSEYDNWNEIKDYQDNTGWINKSLLTKRRSLIIITSLNRISMYNKPDDKSRMLLYLKNFVIGDYLECKDDWCRMKIEGKKGWVRKNHLFGHN